MRAAWLASVALATAPFAHAQGASNNQYQSGAAEARTEVQVGAGDNAAVAAIASGNAASNSSRSLSNLQHMDGTTSAHADAEISELRGYIGIFSAAVGSGLAAVSDHGALAIDSRQLSHADTHAVSTLRATTAGDASISTAASGNVGAVSAEFGELRLNMEQDGAASVSANAIAEAGSVTGQLSTAAIASANNITAAGTTITSLSSVRQDASGQAVSARAEIRADRAGDASSSAIANANSTTIDNQWGYLNASIRQDATTSVNAAAAVTLGEDFLGIASSSAYGVGNQAAASNIGSDTVLDVVQNNSGAVNADAVLSGGEGATGLAAAAAYGNSVSGSLCSECALGGPALSAENVQNNAGDVRARARVSATRNETTAAASTAIGNAATFQATPPG
ncbi:MAG: holdfast anchor protein HfaD [Terricaulis sp.]